MLEYDDSSALSVIGAKLMLAQAKCEILSDDEIRPIVSHPPRRQSRSVLMLEYDDSTTLAVIRAKLRRAQAKRRIMSNDKIRPESPTLRECGPNWIYFDG